MNPPRREKPRPSSSLKTEARREKPRPSSSLKTEARRKKPRPSSSLKTKVNPARRKRSHPPGFKSYRAETKLELKLYFEKLTEAAKNPDWKKNEKFWRDWNISDGFEGEPPLGLMGGPWVIKDVNDIGPSLRNLANDCARQAIKYENDVKKSNLEFVELVKFNMENEYAQVFYLTFKAKDGEGREDVYQAKVFVPYQVQGEEGKQETEVHFCRKRPSEYQQSKGVEKKRKKRCRCGETKEGCGEGGRSCDCTTPGVEKKRKKRFKFGKTKEGCCDGGSSYVSSS